MQKTCVIFGAQFDKNNYKYKVQTIIQFKGILNSLYIHNFKKAHVLNETLSLEFMHVMVVKKKTLR